MQGLLRGPGLHRRALWPAQQRQARHVARAAPRPQHPNDPEPQLASMAKALEHLSLAVALGAHAAAILQQQQLALPQAAAPARQAARREAGQVVMAAPSPQPALSRPVGGVWLTLPLLVAFLFHKLHAALTSPR